jgi:hypothetical protein
MYKLCLKMFPFFLDLVKDSELLCLLAWWVVVVVVAAFLAVQG